jgi:hypothetical protein
VPREYGLIPCSSEHSSGKINLEIDPCDFDKMIFIFKHLIVLMRFLIVKIQLVLNVEKGGLDLIME